MKKLLQSFLILPLFVFLFAVPAHADTTPLTVGDITIGNFFTIPLSPNIYQHDSNGSTYCLLYEDNKYTGEYSLMLSDGSCPLYYDDFINYLAENNIQVHLQVAYITNDALNNYDFGNSNSKLILGDSNSFTMPYLQNNTIDADCQNYYNGGPSRWASYYMEIVVTNLCLPQKILGNTIADYYYYSYTTEQGTKSTSPYVFTPGETEFTYANDISNGNILYNVYLKFSCGGNTCGSLLLYDNSQGLVLFHPPVINSLQGASMVTGSNYSESGVFSDEGSWNWHGTIDYGDGTGEQDLQLLDNSFNLSHTYASQGVYTVTVKITDEGGLTGTAIATVTVINNVSPVVSNVQLSPSQTNVNTTVNASSSFTDADSGNTHTASIDWGDGVVTDGTVNETDGTVTGNHQYTSAGTYTVTVTVTDNHNATGSGNASVTVINPGPFTLYPTADSYLKQGSPNENEGASTFMRLQSSGHNRGVVKFDESQIQSSVVNQNNFTAKLQLTITNNSNNWGTTGRSIELHRLVKDWVEGNGFIDGNSPANRGTGSGVTWSCATDSNIHNQNNDCSGGTAWNMTNSSLWPFASAVTASSTITNNQSGVVEFDVTADVQSFLSGTNQNDGWLLKKTDEGANGQVSFGSKESGSTPKLILTPQ